MRIPAETVAAASKAWVWVPETATTVETPEYLLVRFPAWFDVDLELLRFDPQRPGSEVLDEVLERAREFDVTEVSCWVKLGADPAQHGLFQERGGELDETLDVLAVELATGLPDLGSWDPALHLRWVTDEQGILDSALVGVEVFGGSMPPDDEVTAAAERARADVASGSGSVVAYLDGRPVGTGGLSLVDGVARLWGGAVREEARGRGVYRAILSERMRRGVEGGATMALVKGRVETSGPILRRAGFERYGEERSYRVPLA
jgi:GNAT superfamily N-acetyltransferase